MRTFDAKAFLKRISEVDDRHIREDLHDIGIVLCCSDDDVRKAVINFIRFIDQEDQDAKNVKTPESFLFEELIHISQWMDEIVQTLSGNFPFNICDLSNKLNQIKGKGGRRRIL